MNRPLPLLVVAGLAVLLAACTPSAEGAQQAGVTTRTAMQDNMAAWKGLFKYSPKDRRPHLPQTRYCYQMQSDIVCYDSPQPNMTAKITGYQDGNSISWVQPGGGSLGHSGGEPTAPHDARTVQVAPSVSGSTAMSVGGYNGGFDSASSTIQVTETPQAPATAPFATGESPYVTP